MSNHDTKILTYPEKPDIPASLVASSTTPAAVSIILSKTSTTSVVRSVSSRNQSAIGHVHPPSAFNASKYFATSTLKPSSTTAANISLPLEEDYKAEEEYEDYLEEELGPDPFYKDIPKLERQRQRRSAASQPNATNLSDITRLKKKYVMLLKFIKKNKYNQDPQNQAAFKEKLNMLKELIQVADEQMNPRDSNSSADDNTQTVKFITAGTGETTLSNTEDEMVYTFPTLTPPTPPASRHDSSASTQLKAFKTYEFTLLAKNSFIHPFYIFTPTSTLAGTRSPVPSSVPVTSQTHDTTTTRVTMDDLINIPEYVPTYRVTPKRKLVHEDYFGSISSSKTESIRELLQRLRSKTLPKKPQVEDPTLWFSSNDTNTLLGGNFTESQCTGKDFYNEFFASNETNENLTSSPAVKLLLGTRYIKLCNQCVSQRILLVFLIETRYLLDTVQYRQIKQAYIEIRPEELVDIIELKSRIKVLQFKRKDNTFKVVKEMSTSTNPRFVVKNIVERIEATSKNDKMEKSDVENH